MAILKSHFYHKTINLYTAVFTNLFSELTVLRDDGTEVKVPLAYAGQPKYNARADADNTTEITFMKRSPRMSFQLTAWQRDTTRMKNKMQRLTNLHSKNPATDPITSQYNRVPYNFTYRLDITTKYIDDMLQLVEQILVYFNPSVAVSVKDNPDLDDDSSILITLQSNSFENDFQGSFDNKREVTYTLEFQLEGYLYLPSNDTGVIKHVTINYYDLSIDPPLMLETDEYGPEDALTPEQKAEGELLGL